jgi:hypothetical protein
MEHAASPVRATGSAAEAAAAALRRPVPAAEPWEAPDLAPEFDAARRALDELTAARLELRFQVDDRRRVTVQVMHEDGRVVREIPAHRLFDAICGGGLLIDGRA